MLPASTFFLKVNRDIVASPPSVFCTKAHDQKVGVWVFSARWWRPTAKNELAAVRLRVNDTPSARHEEGEGPASAAFTPTQ
jgi:hypothetical protein